MLYLCVKWLHILSSTVLFGTGIGTAFFMLMANRTRDLKAIRFATRTVVIADWLFTTTTIVFQPLSGLYLMHLAQIPFGSAWIVWTFVLYLVAGACWIPVVFIQIRMRRLAEAAAARDEPLPESYRRLFRIWTALGFPAFFALVVVFWLMVAKPV